MRLHHLSVTAFGPFADAVEVDFDEVSLAGLFLIQGPTGAGKTSLLDAICFALYAGVPGSRPGGRALRSDHAARDTVPRVVLDFSTGTRRFRVSRSPEFLRPKRRGPGETWSPASVVLEEHHTGRWVVRSTRADEVGEIVTEVLGMGLEQFSKVVLLPQGEFAAFLRSTAEERRLLLERLFDISTWTGVEEWLAERRRELAAEVNEARAALDTDLARLGETVATLPSEVVGDLPDLTGLPPDAVPTAVEGIRARCEAHAGDALAALSAADLAATGAEAARLEAETLGERQRRGRAARAVLAELEDVAEAHATRVRTVESAARAEALSGDLRALQRAVDHDSSATQSLANARNPLSRMGIANWELPATRGLQAALVEHEVMLGDARRSSAEATRLRSQVARRTDAATGGRAEVDQWRGRVAEAEAAIVAATAEVEVSRAAGVEEARLDREMAVLDDLLRTVQERDTATTEVGVLGDRVRATRDTEQDARERYLTRRQARLDGMAAELAGTLTAGEACGVCGSLEHPAPATAGLTVSADEVVADEEAWLACRALVEELIAAAEVRRQLVRTREADLDRGWAAFCAGARRLDPGVAVGPLGPDDVEKGGPDGPEVGDGVRSAQTGRRPDVAGVRSEIDARSGPRGEAARLASRLAAATSRVTAARQSFTRAADRASEVADRVAAFEAGLAELAEQLARRLGEVESAVGAHSTCPCQAEGAVREGFGQLEHLWAGHRRKTQSVGLLATALEEADRAHAALAAVRATVGAALGEQGFATVQEAVSARLPAADLADLRRESREHDDRLAASRAVLADGEVTAALDLPDVDLVALRVTGDAARQSQRVAQQVQTRAEQSSHRLAGLSQSVVARCRSLALRLETAARTAALADTATGIGPDNALRMRLSSFVLAARLEKVATLANERLGVMGDGRYLLQHTDDLAAGGRRSGLGLVVRDLWTGQVRDTASLSGGESFMASLALALGLADAVREEAGGFDLQTLFIDEGFGTLDDESLEQVLAVLDGLRDGGRAVGVVSHVSDLLTRIPIQICVSKSATGSSVRVRGTSGAAA